MVGVTAAILLSIAGRQSMGRITVFAAASLKEPFTAISRSFEARYPGSKVRLSFAGSQTLASQINHGARADVFASAAMKNLNGIQFREDTLSFFARNKLQIVVRRDLSEIGNVRQLERASRIVVAHETVPAGRYTSEFLTKASKQFGAQWLKAIRSRVVSQEHDVKAVLAKVRLGEADAGVVYGSDALAAGKSVRSVAIPAALNVDALYPAAVPAAALNAKGGRAFIGFLTSAESKKILIRHGYIVPGQGGRGG